MQPCCRPLALVGTSRRITAAEAAAFERPESVRRRFEKELAALFEDQM